MKRGRKRNAAKDAIAEKFALTWKQRRSLTPDVIRWVYQCKGNAARRLLLGVSR